MITERRAARRRLGLIELAPELDGVSKARKVTGHSRQQFHEIRRNFQSRGAERLTAAESRAFAKTPLDPWAPNARLKAAVQRYLKPTGDGRIRPVIGAWDSQEGVADKPAG